MTTKFPGSFPVITLGGLLYGYVFPAGPRPPGPEGMRSPAERGDHSRCGEATHWTYATADIGYVSPFNVTTRRGAVLGLLRQCQAPEPETLALLDLDLAGVLHGLAERFTRRQLARAAITYATARTISEIAEESAEEFGSRTDPEPMDRVLVHQTIEALIGVSTADDVLSAYDKVAPVRLGQDTPFSTLTAPVPAGT